MAIRNPTDLAPSLRPGQRLLGLDVGSKTIGLALSDVSRVIATPAETVRRGKFAADARTVLDFARKYDVAALVIGLPVNMDGSEGPRCQSVRQFAANLLAVQDVELVFWDERLSTVAAQRAMLEADMSRKRRAEAVDKLAAAVILQGFLDRLAHLSKHPSP